MSGLKLTFSNGEKEICSPAYGRRLLYDKTINFRRVVRKVVFTYNTGVTKVEFNDNEEAEATA